MPLGICAMPSTPGIPRAVVASYETTDPPIVGGRATTVGAAATGRSSAYFAAPVTMARASNRVVGCPMIVNALGSFGAGDTAGTVTCAAAAESDPYDALRPSRVNTVESRVVGVEASPGNRFAAAVTRRARAAAATVRIGAYSACTEFDPPVS